MGCTWLRCGGKSRAASSPPPTDPIARPASIQSPSPRPIATVPAVLRTSPTPKQEDELLLPAISESEDTNRSGTSSRVRARIEPTLGQIQEESEHGGSVAAASIRAELLEAIATELPQSPPNSPVLESTTRRGSVARSLLESLTSSAATSVTSFHTAYESMDPQGRRPSWTE
ncbi:hypothetical protein BJ508DRAFT_326543 [Ascobolus immersus RN42]|uniref:Uncharacterized protein n=1 Tax=Ascobolus immersus RN42 TaxID=1160509 RepID=A0A3N4IBA0_ASCIM|nr:hypothetical protein BJ508DRAFT_326543 [Ascobolus immersus RN42]